MFDILNFSLLMCSAIVTSDDCVVWCLDKKYYALMEVENPQLCIIIQHVLLKSMSMAQASAIHSTHPSSCYSLFFMFFKMIKFVVKIN